MCKVIPCICKYILRCIFKYPLPCICKYPLRCIFKYPLPCICKYPLRCICKFDVHTMIFRYKLRHWPIVTLTWSQLPVRLICQPYLYFLSFSTLPCSHFPPNVCVLCISVLCCIEILYSTIQMFIRLQIKLVCVNFLNCVQFVLCNVQQLTNALYRNTVWHSTNVLQHRWKKCVCCLDFVGAYDNWYTPKYCDLRVENFLV